MSNRRHILSTVPALAALAALGHATPGVAQVISGDSLYIGDDGNDTVQRFTPDGSPSGAFVAPGSGGLRGPRGVLFDHAHNLLLANNDTDLSLPDGTPMPGAIHRYNGATGAFLNQLVPALLPNGKVNPVAPFTPDGMALGANNVLYVSDLIIDARGNNPNEPGKIKRYDASTGVFQGDLNATRYPGFSSGRFHPRGLVFGPNGLLYAASRDLPGIGGEILRFDTATGQFVDVFVDGFADSTLDLNRPSGVAFGPDGNLYVTSFRAGPSDTDKVMVFGGPSSTNPGHKLRQVDLGTLSQRAFAQALLFGPGGILYVPISGGSQAGQLRRYDPATLTLLDTPANLGQPLWYLTFGLTNPATLAYNA